MLAVECADIVIGCRVMKVDKPAGASSLWGRGCSASLGAALLSAQEQRGDPDDSAMGRDHRRPR